MTNFGDGAGLRGSQADRGHGSSTVADLAHADVRDRFSEYLDADERLSELERARLEGHLAGCESCRAFLATLRATRDLLRSLPVRQAPRAAKARLLDALPPTRE